MLDVARCWQSIRLQRDLLPQLGCIVSHNKLSGKTNDEQESHEKNIGRTVSISQWRYAILPERSDWKPENRTISAVDVRKIRT